MKLKSNKTNNRDQIGSHTGSEVRRVQRSLACEIDLQFHPLFIFYPLCCTLCSIANAPLVSRAFCSWVIDYSVKSMSKFNLLKRTPSNPKPAGTNNFIYYFLIGHLRVNWNWLYYYTKYSFFNKYFYNSTKIIWCCIGAVGGKTRICNPWSSVSVC